MHKENQSLCSDPFFVGDGVGTTVGELQEVVRGECLVEREGNVAVGIVKVFQKELIETFLCLIADMNRGGEEKLIMKL